MKKADAIFAEIERQIKEFRAEEKKKNDSTDKHHR